MTVGYDVKEGPLRGSLRLALSYIRKLYLFLAHKSIRLKLAVSFSALIALLMLTLGTLLLRRFEFSLVSLRVNDDLRLANLLAEKVRLSLDGLSSDIELAMAGYGPYPVGGDLRSRVDLLERRLPGVHVLSLRDRSGNRIYGRDVPAASEGSAARGLRFLRREGDRLYFALNVLHPDGPMELYGSIDVSVLSGLLTLPMPLVEEAAVCITDRRSRFVIYQVEKALFGGISALASAATIDEANIDIREIMDKGIYRVYWPIAPYDLDIVLIRSLRPIFGAMGFARKVIFLGSVLGGLLGIALAYAITHPLRRLIKGARDVLSGRMDRLIDVRSEDEIGMLAGALNRAMNSLLDMKRYTESILENMSNGLIAVDNDLKVVAVNRAAAAILGASVGEVKGRDIREVLGHDRGNREMGEQGNGRGDRGLLKGRPGV